MKRHPQQSESTTQPLWNKKIKISRETKNNDSVTFHNASHTTKMLWPRLFIIFTFLCCLGVLLRFSSFRNDLVSDRLMPQLQEQIDKRRSSLNESLYQLRFNNSLVRMNVTKARVRPGFQMANETGVSGKYAVIMIPGFITSALEAWESKECAKMSFRQSMWGRVGGAKQWLMDRTCTIEHLALDPITGSDPEGIRVRAAQGFDAADYFLGNFWVWDKILENLSDIGYDGNTMSMESYDWRLSIPMLEERDHYFTKLKYKIETFYKITGKKVVLTSHSFGALVVHYFFAWISADEKNWIDKHVHAYVNIAGAHLGVPKAASALLSGEMKDTVFLGTIGTFVEQFIGRKLRRDLWATWGSIWSMLPKGSDILWNDLITITDNEENEKHISYGSANNTGESMKSTRIINEALISFSSRISHSGSYVIDFLSKFGGGYHQENALNAWHDLSKTPLPRAPNMKIYCLYGVGLDTERSYFYKRNKEETENENEDSLQSHNFELPFILDTTVEDAENKIIHGIRYSDGDGSVPLVSLGYTCIDAWQRKDSGLNPSKVQVITKEYEHRAEFSVDDPLRGGPHSSDHVDILGHNDVLTDLLKIVSDHRIDEVKNEIVSDIREIAKEINAQVGFKKRKGWHFPSSINWHPKKWCKQSNNLFFCSKG